MKKIISFLLCIITLVCLASCTPNTEVTDAPAAESVAQPQYEIKIGVLANQSSSFSNEEKRAVLGIKYAAEKKKSVTIGEQKYDLKLVISNYSKAQNSALEAADDLIASGVNVVIASLDGHDKVASKLKEANIPVIDYSSQSSKLLDENENIFTLCPSGLTKARFCALYAHKNKKSEKAYVISDLSSETSRENALYFKECFESYGKAANISYFEKDETDFSAFAKEIKKDGYDVIYAPIDPSCAQNLLAALNSGDCYADVISDNTWDTQQILNYGDNGFNIYIPSVSSASSNEDFDANYSKWIEADKDLLYLNGGISTASSACVLGYNAYNIAFLAAKKGKSSSSSAIADALKKGTFNIASSEISFGKDRIAKDAKFKMKVTDYDTNTLKFS